EDEAICLSAIMGLEGKNVWRTSSENRLQKFILMQRSFPANIIYLGDVRMSEEGFGWAPWSFVRRTNRDGTEHKFDLETPTAYASESGLHVRYSGFVFMNPRSIQH